MDNKTSTPYSFVAGFVKDKSSCFFVGQFDAIEESSCVIRWDILDKKRYFFDIVYDATQICLFNKQVFVAGVNGIVTSFETQNMYESGRTDDEEDDFKEEEINAGDNGVETHGDIRELHVINGKLYAVGMGRQVYRRDGDKYWTHQDKDILDDPTNTKSISGFNSIDGMEDVLYAAGFGGEVWCCKKGVWEQMDSPTNLILNKVKVVKKDEVYIGGKSGLLMKGNDKVMVIIDHQVTEDEIWDIEWYNKSLYVATRNNIYQLKNDTLETVDTGLGKITCGRLHANDGILMTIGIKDVCITQDGKKWENITPRFKQA